MAEKKRSLRPLETLKKDEREHLYKQVHSEVQSYHYESQTIRLLKKEKKQREIEEQLADKIEEYKQRNLELEDCARKLKEEQEEIKTKIEAKKNPIQNYDHKVKQESEKLSKENGLIISKEAEIKKKLDQKHKVQMKLQEIETKIASYKIYEEILKKVVDQTEDYEEIPQLISRCRTLKKSVENYTT